MASKWVKAAFLAVLGIVILVYADKLVKDLQTNLEDNFDVAFAWTWDLLQILLWILVAWLFVDAALTIALSFSEYRYSLHDVMVRLMRIENKIGIQEPEEMPEFREKEAKDVEVKEVEEELPPPPRE